MNKITIPILSDVWVKASWEDYLKVLEENDLEKAKGYYYNGQYRLEMTPIGNDHASDQTIITYAINLYGTIKNLNLVGKTTCSYRKAGYREVQPDLSYYVGNRVSAVPYGTSIINLDRYPAPDLVIEVSKTTLSDDLGNKRLLYEELGVSEYWIVDVENVRVIAFKVSDGGSQKISTSQVLIGLEIAILEEALRQTRHSDHSRVGRWLMEQFQQNN